MSTRLTFTPNPDTGPDPLTIEQVRASGAGVFGEGDDNPMLAIEDDGTAFALEADGSEFVCSVITDFTPFEGTRRFRRVGGEVEVVHRFQS